MNSRTQQSFVSLQFQEAANTNTTQTVTVQSPQQSSGQQIIQLQQTQQSPSSQTGGLQIIQQVVAPSGEVQNIPVSNEVQNIPVSKKTLHVNTLHLAHAFLSQFFYLFFLDSADSPATPNDSYASTRRK